jgi:hypothetical protein
VQDSNRKQNKTLEMTNSVCTGIPHTAPILSSIIIIWCHVPPFILLQERQPHVQHAAASVPQEMQTWLDWLKSTFRDSREERALGRWVLHATKKRDSDNNYTKETGAWGLSWMTGEKSVTRLYHLKKINKCNDMLHWATSWPCKCANCIESGKSKCLMPPN